MRSVSEVPTEASGKCIKCGKPVPSSGTNRGKMVPARHKQLTFILQRLEVCPACYRKYPEFRRCKEPGCADRVPTRGKDIITFACQMLRLCRYCYRAKFPESPARGVPVAVFPFNQRPYTPEDTDRNPIRDTTAWEFLDEFFGGDR
jgi:hypothetical protein